MCSNHLIKHPGDPLDLFYLKCQYYQIAVLLIVLVRP